MRDFFCSLFIDNTKFLMAQHKKLQCKSKLMFPEPVEPVQESDYRLNPFDDVPMRLQKSVETKSKAATKSRINQLTVGDVRYIFTQLRGCKTLDPNHTLWTGATAGRFSLDYLLQSSSMAGGEARKAKGRLSKADESIDTQVKVHDGSDDDDDDDDDDEYMSDDEDDDDDDDDEEDDGDEDDDEVYDDEDDNNKDDANAMSVVSDER
jgi:hypothetical protein